MCKGSCAHCDTCHYLVSLYECVNCFKIGTAWLDDTFTCFASSTISVYPLNEGVAINTLLDSKHTLAVFQWNQSRSLSLTTDAQSGSKFVAQTRMRDSCKDSGQYGIPELVDSCWLRGTGGDCRCRGDGLSQLGHPTIERGIAIVYCMTPHTLDMQLAMNGTRQ